MVPKPNGNVRLCVDMKCANKAIISERNPIPIIDEVLQDMQEASVFSKLDLKWGYHQIELSEESRSITTFVTHNGLLRYKRLMFGIISAQKISASVSASFFMIPAEQQTSRMILLSMVLIQWSIMSD